MKGQQPFEISAHRKTRGQGADRLFAEIDVGVTLVGEHREIVLVREREQGTPGVFAGAGGGFGRAFARRGRDGGVVIFGSRCKLRGVKPKPIRFNTTDSTD